MYAIDNRRIIIMYDIVKNVCMIQYTSMYDKVKK